MYKTIIIYFLVENVSFYIIIYTIIIVSIKHDISIKKGYYNMMYYTENVGYTLAQENYDNADRIRNPETLNIFCDGSCKVSRGTSFGGFAALATVCYNVQEVFYRGWTQEESFASDLMELYALRSALSMVYRWKDIYPTINVFSDSVYAIKSVKNWIYNWHYDCGSNLYYKTTKQNETPKNISLIYEIATSFITLMGMTTNLNLYFVKGHINHMGSVKNLQKAAESFKLNNGIKGKVDLNLIRYLSYNNDLADYYAKKGSNEIDFNCNRRDAIEFIPQDINKYAQEKIISSIKFY